MLNKRLKNKNSFFYFKVIKTYLCCHVIINQFICLLENLFSKSCYLHLKTISYYFVIITNSINLFLCNVIKKIICQLTVYSLCIHLNLFSVCYTWINVFSDSIIYMFLMFTIYITQITLNIRNIDVKFFELKFKKICLLYY